MKAYLKYIACFFIVFIGFEAFGLREQGASGLGNDSVGIYGIFQLVFLLILTASLVAYIIFFEKIRVNDHLSFAIHFLFFLFLTELLVSIVTSFSTGYPLTRILYNFYSLKYYLIFFFLCVWFKDILSVQRVVSILAVGAILSACVFLFFAFVYQFPSVIQKITGDQLGRELRYLVPTGMLITFGMNYYISKMVYEGVSFVKVLIFALLFFAVFMQLHRNVHLSLLIIFLIVFNTIYLKKQKKAVRASVYLSVAVLGFFFIKGVLDNADSIIATSIEEATNDTGGVGIRIAIMINSINYVWGHSPFLGIGFIWQDFDIYSLIFELFALAPTNDNAYTNILLCFGLTGMLVFGYLIFAVFNSLKKLKKIENKSIQVLRYSIYLTMIYILISGFGSDNFIAYNSTIIFVIVITILNNINQLVNEQTIGK